MGDSNCTIAPAARNGQAQRCARSDYGALERLPPHALCGLLHHALYKSLAGRAKGLVGGQVSPSRAALRRKNTFALGFLQVPG